MLVMWRRPGESLVVGESIEIEVIEARPNRVKLGVVAPDSVSIVRKETRIIPDENVTAAWSTRPCWRHLPAFSEKGFRG